MSWCSGYRIHVSSERRSDFRFLPSMGDEHVIENPCRVLAKLPVQSWNHASSVLLTCPHGGAQSTEWICLNFLQSVRAKLRIIICPLVFWKFFVRSLTVRKCQHLCKVGTHMKWKANFVQVAVVTNFAKLPLVKYLRKMFKNRLNMWKMKVSPV